MNAGTRPAQPRAIYLVVFLAVCLVLCLALTICIVASPRPEQIHLPHVVATETDAQTGEDRIMAAVDAPLGPFTVELTQEEATSLLALRLPGSPFLDPQVHFTNNRVYIAGVVNMGVPLRVMSVWSVVSPAGQPRVQLERASIGPFALPTLLLNSVSSTINEMIDESGTGVVATDVQIGEGRILVKGVKSAPTVPSSCPLIA